MKRLLVVAYYFPPCNVTATHRPLAFVKYLAQEGWHSTVLCARNPRDDRIEAGRDDALLSKVPPGTDVIRATDLNLMAWITQLRERSKAKSAVANGPEKAPVVPGTTTVLRTLKHYLASRLCVPDEYQGWYLPALAAGRRLFRSRPIDAIFSSGPPWTGHMIARRLARTFGVPWVADFRDPWVTHPFVDIPLETLRKRNAEAEARVVRSATAIVCVLETMREDFLARYPDYHPEDIVTIPNGFDPEDYVGLASEPEAALVILHAGTLYGRRRIDPLFTAVKEWRRIDPVGSAQLQVRLLGGTPEEANELQRTIERWELQGCVRAEGEVSHREALNNLSRAAVLLVVGFSGPGDQLQMTGKIFEYLAVRRPILALAPPSCPVGDLLRETGVRHWIVSPDDQVGLLSALTDIAAQWKEGKLCGPENGRLEAFSRKKQAQQLSHLLERLVGTRNPEASARPTKGVS